MIGVSGLREKREGADWVYGTTFCAFWGGGGDCRFAAGRS